MSKEEAEAKRRAAEIEKNKAVVEDGIAFPRMAYQKGTNNHRVVRSKDEYEALLKSWGQTHEESGRPKVPDNFAHLSAMKAKAELAEKPAKSATKK